MHLKESIAVFVLLNLFCLPLQEVRETHLSNNNLGYQNQGKIRAINHLQIRTVLSGWPNCHVVFDESTTIVNFRQPFNMVFACQRLFRTCKSSDGSSLLLFGLICSTQSPLTKVIKL